MLTPRCCYQVDAEDRIISIEGAWSAFARENGGQALLDNPPLGRSLWDFIQGTSTRNIYHIIMKHVRKSGRAAQFPFRCDSPHTLRYMEMRVSLGEEGSLWFQTSIAKEVPAHTAKTPAETSGERDYFVHMCAWCDRVQVGSEWVPLETAIWSLALLDAPKAPPITHDICLTCYNQLQQNIAKAKSQLGEQNFGAKM